MKSLFKLRIIALFMIALIIALPLTLAANTQSGASEQQLPDPSEACYEKSKESSGIASFVNSDVMRTLEAIAMLAYTLCSTMSAIDSVMNLVSNIIGLIDVGTCCRIPYPAGPKICEKQNNLFEAWKEIYAPIKPLCCLVNCGWCTGEGCGGIASGISNTMQNIAPLAKIPPVVSKANFGASSSSPISSQPASGIGQFHSSPYENIYMAVGCLCPVAILFNLKKLGAIYDSYDCCIKQACEAGIDTKQCDHMLSTATCMYWKGSILKSLVNAALSFIAQMIPQFIQEQWLQQTWFNCILLVYDLVQTAKTIQSLIGTYQMLSESFGKPACDTSKMKKIAEKMKKDAALKGAPLAMPSPKLMYNGVYITKTDKYGNVIGNEVIAADMFLNAKKWDKYNEKEKKERIAELSKYKNLEEYKDYLEKNPENLKSMETVLGYKPVAITILDSTYSKYNKIMEDITSKMSSTFGLLRLAIDLQGTLKDSLNKNLNLKENEKFTDAELEIITKASSDPKINANQKQLLDYFQKNHPGIGTKFIKGSLPEAIEVETKDGNFAFEPYINDKNELMFQALVLDENRIVIEEPATTDNTDKFIAARYYGPLLRKELAPQIQSEAMYQLLSETLGRFAYSAIDKMCEDDWKSSKPQSNKAKKWTSGGNVDPLAPVNQTAIEDSNAACTDSNVNSFTAQAKKSSKSYSYSYSIAACKSTLSYNVYLDSPSGRYSLKTGSVDKGKLKKEAGAQQFENEYTKICIEARSSENTIEKVCSGISI